MSNYGFPSHCGSTYGQATSLLEKFVWQTATEHYLSLDGYGLEPYWSNSHISDDKYFINSGIGRIWRVRVGGLALIESTYWGEDKLSDLSDDRSVRDCDLAMTMLLAGHEVRHLYQN